VSEQPVDAAVSAASGPERVGTAMASSVGTGRANALPSFRGYAARGVVVAPQPTAAAVGVDVIRAGGNAIDAALAAAFVQGVVDPFMGGIGGFGSLIVHEAKTGQSTVIGYHGRAGSLARPDIFADQVLGQVHGHAERFSVKDGANQVGYKSIVVPGVPAGFAAAHQRFGRLPWATLLQPAIALARDGVPVSDEVYDRWLEIPEAGHIGGLDRIKSNKECAAIFAPRGEYLLPGTLVRQPAYADALERLGRAGFEDFYRGDIARQIGKDMAANGGLFNADDLAAYQPDIGPPVIGRYRGLDIHGLTLPASGVQLIELLNTLEHFDLRAIHATNRAQYIHVVARAIQASFADRARFMGDPRFLAVPVERLCSAEHGAELAELVRSERPIEVPGIGYREAMHTTHVCALDVEGNAVSLTHTLGSASAVITPGLGFIYNNCMYQFHPYPGHPNSIAPGKSRLTGICGTVLLKDRRPWLTVGALGGTRMQTAVLHTILNIVDHGRSPIEAVEAPRFVAESAWLEIESRLGEFGPHLAAKGWRLRTSPRGYDLAFGLAFAALCADEGGYLGGSDPRGGGGISFA
jgi:gamma-glutamyltranspeptidase / glutathione hydrolase